MKRKQFRLPAEPCPRRRHLERCIRAQRLLQQCQIGLLKSRDVLIQEGERVGLGGVLEPFGLRCDLLNTCACALECALDGRRAHVEHLRHLSRRHIQHVAQDQHGSLSLGRC